MRGRLFCAPPTQCARPQSGSSADQISVKRDLSSVKRDLRSVKRDLTSVKRDLISVQSDLISVTRDLVSVERDLVSVKRDLVRIQNLDGGRRRDEEAKRQLVREVHDGKLAAKLLPNCLGVPQVQDL